jgi:hypothetical protein
MIGLLSTVGLWVGCVGEEEGRAVGRFAAGFGRGAKEVLKKYLTKEKAYLSG